MNQGPLIFLGIYLAMALSWLGMVFLPQTQLGRLQETTVPPAGARYPTPRSGPAQEGRAVYRANGCYYCHTQQVRAPGAGADFERGWGKRHSVATDYLYEHPVMLGSVRVGPDLANIGVRQPDAATHLLHLYNPQLTAKGSTMPPYRFLFEKRKVRAAPSPDALQLAGELAPEAGYEIVPRPEALALVAYLQSLQAGVSLFEAPLPLPPKKAGTGSGTNQPPAGSTATNPPAVSAPPQK
jgi:cytochrome c oxidase cbb3-type subunit 2